MLTVREFPMKCYFRGSPKSITHVASFHGMYHCGFEIHDPIILATYVASYVLS